MVTVLAESGAPPFPLPVADEPAETVQPAEEPFSTEGPAGEQTTGDDPTPQATSAKAKKDTPAPILATVLALLAATVVRRR